MRNRDQAFSLIELIITLSIFVILFAVVAPTWKVLSQKNKLKAFVQHLGDEIQFAEQVAINIGSTVSFCGSANLTSCDGLWNQGRVVMIKSSRKIVAIFQNAIPGYSFRWISSFSRNVALSFDANGFTHGQQGHFLIFDKHNNKLVAKIIVLETGRIRVAYS